MSRTLRGATDKRPRAYSFNTRPVRGGDAVTMTTTTSRRGAVLAVLLTGQAMASMDGSIVSVAVQTIRERLGADGVGIQLIVSGYLLTTGLLLVTCARLGDIAGHRRAFWLGLGWFTAASLLCGLAPDVTVLVLARVAQAVGAALLLPQVFSLIQRGWEGAARQWAIGLYSMILAAGVALGQIIGGLLVTADLFGLGWRPAFLVNVPIGVVLLLAGPRVLTAASDTTRAVPRPRLDLGGVAILTVAMAAIIGPLIFGRELGLPVWVWAVVAGGVGLLLVFVRYERGRPRDPLLDLDVLRARGVRPGLVACCVVMGCYTAFLLTLTLRLQSSLGFSPLAAGLAFVPYAVGFGALSLAWSRLPVRVQHALPVAGPLAFAACAVTLVALTRHGWLGPVSVPLLFMAGAGHAAGYSPLIARVSSLIDPRRASALSALNSTGPLLAGVLAVATVGGLYFAAGSPSTGLTRVTAAIAALLLTATACATRVALTAGKHERGVIGGRVGVGGRG